MNEKEKAEELVDIYLPWADGVERQEDDDQVLEHLINAKRCAIMCVDELIEQSIHCYECGGTYSEDYYIKVKEEINKL